MNPRTRILITIVLIGITASQFISGKYYKSHPNTVGTVLTGEFTCLDFEYIPIDNYPLYFKVLIPKDSTITIYTDSLESVIRSVTQNALYCPIYFQHPLYSTMFFSRTDRETTGDSIPKKLFQFLEDISYFVDDPAEDILSTIEQKTLKLKSGEELGYQSYKLIGIIYQGPPSSTSLEINMADYPEIKHGYYPLIYWLEPSADCPFSFK